MFRQKKSLLPPIDYPPEATYFDAVYDTAIGRMKGRILATSAEVVAERIKRHLEAEIVSITPVTKMAEAGGKTEVRLEL